MSRGHGKTERALIDTLTGEWQTVAQLTAQITGKPEPSRGMLESVRRACRKLDAEGYAELDYLMTDQECINDDEMRAAAAVRDWSVRRKYRTRVRRWSDLGDGRNAYDPQHQPLHPGWQLAARVKC
jgi:CTP:molybdopterin cytidylyltransferase MocA